MPYDISSVLKTPRIVKKKKRNGTKEKKSKSTKQKKNNEVGLSFGQAQVKLKVIVEVEFGVDVEACHY